MNFSNVLKLVGLSVLLALPSYGQLLSGTRIQSDVSAGALLCLEELYSNGSDAACLQAPSDISSEFTLTLPATLPSGGTKCVEVTTTGVIQYAGAACGSGGGGSAVGSAGDIQLSDGAAGFTNLTGFNHSGEQLSIPRSSTSPSTEGGQIFFQGDTGIAADFILDVASGDARLFTDYASDRSVRFFNLGAGDLNLIITGDIIPTTDSTYTLGTPSSQWLNSYIDTSNIYTAILPDTDGGADIGNGTSNRFGTIWSDDSRTEELFFQRQGQASYDFVFQNTTANRLDLLDSSASQRMRFNFNVSWLASIYSNLSVTGNLTPAADSSYDLGSASPLFWRTAYIDTIYASTALYPYTDGLPLGSTSNQFDAHMGTITSHGSISPYTGLGGLTLGDLSHMWFSGASRTWSLGFTGTSDGGLYFYRNTGSGTASLVSATYSTLPAIEADALAISSTGSFYARQYSGGSVNCATGGPGSTALTTGWLGVRTDTGGASGAPQIEVCIGGSLRYIGLN